jgi:two-component system sensor histidine kinase ChiS
MTKNPPLKKTVILIVDDNPINLDVLLNLLDEADFDVLVATDGLSALEQAAYAQPDLILLDVMMPHLDGYETCRRLKAQPQTADIPVIFITALAEAANKVKGFEVGGVDYITKPFEHQEVLARLHTHLSLRRLRQELSETNATLEDRVTQRTQELSAINRAYSRFIPPEFLSLLNKNSITQVKLGDQRQMEMTILFADIRDFTGMSETMTPQENFNFLNAYLSRVSPIIRQHGGFIDKYIGDAIMALFPHPEQQGDQAVQAAIAMQNQITAYNLHREQQGLPRIRVGIGLHTGLLMLGTIGESERLESTVISDAVNLAARLEGLSKIYGSQIMMSERTLLKLYHFDQYHYRFLDRVVVKGKTEPVSVFEIFDSEPEVFFEIKQEDKDAFEAALFDYYDQNFEAAKAQLYKIVQHNPHDTAAKLYLKRIADYQKQGLPPDWSGIESMLSK